MRRGWGASEAQEPSGVSRLRRTGELGLERLVHRGWELWWTTGHEHQVLTGAHRQSSEVEEGRRGRACVLVRWEHKANSQSGQLGLVEETPPTTHTHTEENLPLSLNGLCASLWGGPRKDNTW